MKSSCLYQIGLPLVMSLVLSAPALAFSDSDFLQDLGDSPAFFEEVSFGTDKVWSAEFGIGISMPRGFTMEMPDLNHFFLSESSILIISTERFPVETRNSFTLDTSVFRKLTSWASLGGHVSYAFNHALEVGRADVEEHSNFVFGFTANPSFEYDVSSSLSILELTPLLKLGPGLHSAQDGLRPYIVAGVGGYYVTQNAHVEMDGTKFNYFNNEEIYLGATAGGGLAWTTKYGKLAAEARYQEVFQAGQNLHFLLPMLRVSRAF